MLRVGRISYLNVEPFFHAFPWPIAESLPPRALGEATASLALHFGASDVNGTLEDEKIAHMAQAASPAGLATEQILRMVRDAGKIPVERDALYNVVKVWS